MVYSQRVHSQLDILAKVPLAYSICLTLEMLARSSLYYNIHLPAFSGFIMLRKKAQYKGAGMSGRMLWFCSNQRLFAILYISYDVRVAG